MIRRTHDESANTDGAVPADTTISETETPLHIICNTLKERDVAVVIDVCIGAYTISRDHDGAIGYLTLVRMKNDTYRIYEFLEVELVLGRDIRRVLYLNEVMSYPVKSEDMTPNDYIGKMFARYVDHAKVNKLNRFGMYSFLYESLFRGLFEGNEDPLILEVYRERYKGFTLHPRSMDHPDGYISDITHMYPNSIELH